MGVVERVGVAGVGAWVEGGAVERGSPMGGCVEMWRGARCAARAQREGARVGGAGGGAALGGAWRACGTEGVRYCGGVRRAGLILGVVQGRRLSAAEWVRRVEGVRGIARRGAWLLSSLGVCGVGGVRRV